MSLRRKVATVVGAATLSSTIAGAAAFAHGFWLGLLLAELATLAGVLGVAYVLGRNRG